MTGDTARTRLEKTQYAPHWKPSPRIVDFLLLAPSLLLVVIVLGIPLALIVATRLQPHVLLAVHGPALKNYEYLATRGYYLDIVIRTLSESCITVVIAVPLGYLGALGLRDLRGRLGNLAIMGLTFPILTGPLVVVLGWMALLPDHGPIFGPLVSAGLIAPPRLLGTQTAVVISLVQFTLPFAILTIFTILRQIPVELYEAATSLGAGPPRTFWRITLPLSLPGVLSSAIITFSLAASSYISPHYLGGAAELTLTTVIAQFMLATYNSPFASAAAVMLLLMTLSIIVLLSWPIRRAIRT